MDWKEMEGDKRGEIVLGIVVDVVLFFRWTRENWKNRDEKLEYKIFEF